MNLSEIKDIRRSLGLTQSELAKMAGISQATIARIEAGNVDPAFANAQRVFSALDKVKKTQLPKHVSLQDIMSRKVIYIESTANLRKAAIIMKRKNISQMPVIEKGAIVGSITEADISHAVFSRNPEKLSVKDVMKSPMPAIDVNSSIDLVVGLLDHSPALLITKRGSAASIITRADMLKLIKR